MHEGHRQRLYAKLESGDNLYEHELLEILLFNAYSRRDVNPIAHALLKRFASIKEIMNAPVNELCEVEGVGRSVALYLRCIGECVKLSNGCDSFAIIKNTDQFEKFIATRFRGLKVEKLELYFMDKAGKVKRIFEFCSEETDCVNMPSEDITKLIAIQRPYGIFVAHNHVNYSSDPSAADDAFTKRMQLICYLNAVRFYDHCIYAGDDNIFSYFLSSRIDIIKEEIIKAKILKDG